MKQKCKTCGKNADSDFCWKHKPNKQLQQRGIKPALAKKVNAGETHQKSTVSNKQLSEMKQFFMRYWKENKQHTCEVCRVWLGSDPRTYMFDHVLEKSKYPELAFEEENIMYLCLLCHDKKTRGHHDIITKERVEYLKNKFNL